MSKQSYKSLSVLLVTLVVLVAIGLPQRQSSQTKQAAKKKQTVQKVYKKISGEAYTTFVENFETEQASLAQSFFWPKLPKQLRYANIVYSDSKENVSGLRGEIELKRVVDTGRKGGALRVKKGDVLALNQLQKAVITDPGQLPPVDVADPPAMRRVAVVLLNYSDKQMSCKADDGVSDIPIAQIPAKASETMWTGVNSVANRYLRASYDKVLFDPDGNADGQPDVFGPFTLSYPSSDSCNFNAYATQAKSMALARGIDLSKFQHVIYAFPRNERCSFFGATWDGTADFACGDKCRAFLNGQYCYGLVYAHELGHNFGLYHSYSLDPGKVGNPPPGPHTVPYGDESCFMGHGRLTALSAPQRSLLGWIPSYRIQDVNTTGDYDIYSTDVEPASVALSPQIIKIFRPAQKDYYYLSYRTRLAFESALTEPALMPDFTRGLSLHTIEPSALRVPTLIGTVGSGITTTRPWENYPGLFSDATNQVSISVNQKFSDHISVHVDFSAPRNCQMSAPSLEPALLADGKTYLNGLNLDTPKQVLVRLRNNDIGLDCRPRSFTVRVTPPSGWGPVSDQIVSIAAGAIRTVSLDLLPPVSATEGPYPFRFETVPNNLNVGVPTDALVAVSALNADAVFDRTVPSAINNLTATVTGQASGYYSVHLSWAAPFDSGGEALSPVALNNYCIYRNTSLVVCRKITSNPIYFDDTKITFPDGTIIGPRADQTLTYYVVTQDAAGNESPPSNLAVIPYRERLPPGPEDEPMLDAAM